jgi:hypothetical protein
MLLTLCARSDMPLDAQTTAREPLRSLCTRSAPVGTNSCSDGLGTPPYDA